MASSITWNGALSIKIFLLKAFIFEFISINYLEKISLVIQAFEFHFHTVDKFIWFIFSKQWGVLLLLITRGRSFSPKILKHNKTISLSFNDFVPFQGFPLNSKVLLDSVLKNNLISSALNMYFISYSSKRDGKINPLVWGDTWSCVRVSNRMNAKGSRKVKFQIQYPDRWLYD